MQRSAGKRNAKRIAVLYPVKLWGMDANGHPFIETAITLNVSRSGALLKEVPAKLTIGDVIGLRSGRQKCRFRVVWLGQEGTPEAEHLGLQSLEPEKNIWALNLPVHSIDIYSRPMRYERRLIKRLECLVSAEVAGHNCAGRARAFVTDLSPGGCYVSIATPFPIETKLTIALWLDARNRIWADAIVISHHLNLGMGVKFVNISRKNMEDLTQFLDGLTRRRNLSPIHVAP